MHAGGRERGKIRTIGLIPAVGNAFYAIGKIDSVHAVNADEQDMLDFALRKRERSRRTRQVVARRREVCV